MRGTGGILERVNRAARDLGVDIDTCGPISRDLVMEKAGVPVIAGGDHLMDTLGIAPDASLAQIGDALRKAAITTGTAADAMLAPGQATSFIRRVSDADPFGQAIRVEPRDRPSGSVEKIGVAAGLIRAAVENADDGYRAAPTFGNVPYQVVGVRLPWEITNQFLRYNIEGQSAEDTIWNLMTGAFGRDLSRLDLLGDTGSGDPSLSIDDGLLKYFATNASGNIHRVNCANGTIGVTWPNKKILFALQEAMPEKYRAGALQEGQADNLAAYGATTSLRWLASPAVVDEWVEYLTDRVTPGGDALLAGGGPLAVAPLGIPWMRIPNFPSNRIVLSNPQNFVRIVTTQIERYRVGPETDWELATRRKRGYVFFLDRDIVTEEDDAVVDGYNVGS
jgi:hypothetical protein